MSAYEVALSRHARRQHDALDRTVARRIRPLVESLGDDPRPPGCRQLVGQAGRWRVRVGDWRIVYEIDDAGKVVVVTDIKHRSAAYRQG